MPVAAPPPESGSMKATLTSASAVEAIRAAAIDMPSVTRMLARMISSFVRGRLLQRTLDRVRPGPSRRADDATSLVVPFQARYNRGPRAADHVARRRDARADDGRAADDLVADPPRGPLSR